MKSVSTCSGRSGLPWLAALVVVISLQAAATTYYVDANAGNDALAGTSEAQAWKTLAKVNTQGRVSGFAAGDSILFKRGATWRETLLVFDPSNGKHSSGTADAPITFGAYGIGNDPVISGSNRVTGWTLQGGNIWKASLAFTATSYASNPEVVYFDGERGDMKSAVSELAGAKAWYWASNTLYVYATQNPDTLYASSGVEVAARDYCIWGVYQCGANYIVVQDLELKNANHKNLIVDVDNHHWTIRNVVAHHNGKVDGNDKNNFYLAGGTGHLVSHCRLYQAGANNINVLECANTVIEWNESYDCHHHTIDMKGGVTGTRPAQDNVIRYNYTYLSPGFVSPVAINGIFVGLGNAPGLSRTKVHHNVVANMSDCGIQVDMYATDIEVYNNVVVNSKNANYYLCTDGAVTLKNNIGLNTGVSSGLLVAVVRGMSAKTIDFNCWYPATSTFAESSVDGSKYTMYTNWTTYRNATGFDAHSINADPLLADVSKANFHLQASSPCIDAGVAVGLSTDRDGVSIAQGSAPDIGAYETVASQAGTDTTPPVISLLGQPAMTLEVGTAFADPGVMAADDKDGDITARIVKSGVVDSAHLGAYALSYDVSDSAGNQAARVTRTVQVVDITKPVITPRT